MPTPQLLGDLFDVHPVHAGDFVLNLGEDDTEAELRDYVVTPELSERFDEALGLIRSAVEGSRGSRAAYLDGSFGAGKSHFMAVLRAILRGEPAARGKAGLADVVASHDSWLQGKQFLQISQHMIDRDSLEEAVLGGYVKLARRIAPDKRLPAVYRDDELLKGAASLRADMGDESFIASLPSDEDQGVAADEWGDLADTTGWTADTLDAAFGAQPGDERRERLVSALLKTAYFSSYTELALTGSYVDMDTGLSVISRHAKDVLGCDAIVLLLDELVLWLSKFIGGDSYRLRDEAQKVSKLVESSESDRPAPIISFLPRQRDLRELVGKDMAGNETESLFDTLNYWSGRFDRISLSDMNLPAVVEKRLLIPKDDAAESALDSAFNLAQNNRRRKDVWDALIDNQAGSASVDDFRRTYPFPPAFMHTIVDVSGALQRNRTALKLLAQLLYNQREMPIGQLMPLGLIFEVLLDGQDRPFDVRLQREFQRTKDFYLTELRPYLLSEHNLTETEAKALPPRHPFRAADMVAKTLMLSVLVPKVAALQGLTASRLAALNQGAVNAAIPGTERGIIARILKDLNSRFGQITLTRSENPTVTVTLMDVNTDEIIMHAQAADTVAARKRELQRLLWEQLGLDYTESQTTETEIVWRGTRRLVEVVYTNIREHPVAEMPSDRPGVVRVLIDYPFDEHRKGPADDRRQVQRAQQALSDPKPPVVAWIPAFLTGERQEDLGKYVIIRYLLGSEDRLEDAAPNLTSDERAEARNNLKSRFTGLQERFVSVLRQAYGIDQPDDADIEQHPDDQLMGVEPGWRPQQPSAASSPADALGRMVKNLLDYTYPDHPNLDVDGKGQSYRRSDIDAAYAAVEKAAADRNGRGEITKEERRILRRTVGPLGIGAVNEGSIVIAPDLAIELNQRATAAEHPEEVTVAHVREWVRDMKPGLPPDLVDLLVAVYAVVDDRTWIRGGVTIDPPRPGALAAEMRLRKQPLPDRDVFEAAEQRATALFEIESRPAFNSRSIASIARQVRQVLHERGHAVAALADGLAAHATTLGLEESTPRLETANRLRELFADLEEVRSDDNALIECLAAADLERENAIYTGSMGGAVELAMILNGEANSWAALDRLCSDPQPEAARILARLRAVAEKDQHEKSLAPAIKDAFTAAINLLVKPDPVPPPPPPTPGKTGPGLPLVRTAKAGRFSAVAAEIAAELDPKATYEIIVRRVEDR